MKSEKLAKGKDAFHFSLFTFKLHFAAGKN